MRPPRSLFATFLDYKCGLFWIYILHNPYFIFTNLFSASFMFLFYIYNECIENTKEQNFLKWNSSSLLAGIIETFMSHKFYKVATKWNLSNEKKQM